MLWPRTRPFVPNARGSCRQRRRQAGPGVLAASPAASREHSAQEPCTLGARTGCGPWAWLEGGASVLALNLLFAYTRIAEFPQTRPAGGIPDQIGSLMQRYILWLLPTAAAFGSFVPGVGRVFGFRVLVLLLFTLVLFKPNTKPRRTRSFSRFRVLAFAWILVSLVGLMFVKDVDAALTDTASIFSGLLLGYALVVARGGFLEKLAQIYAGWVLSFLATTAIAVYELTTGSHLSNYFAGASVVGIDTRLIASAFGNPNAYAVYLVTTAGLFVKSVMGAKRRTRVAALLGMGLCAFLIVETGSRLCTLAVLVELVTLLLLAKPGYRKLIVGFLGAAIVTFGAVTVATSSTIAGIFSNANLVSVSFGGFLDEIVEGGDYSSGGRRLDLYRDGIWMIWHTGGVGVGPGNFDQTMRDGAVPYPAAGVVDPHNVYFEVGAQYGLVMLVAFMAWLFMCTRHSYFASRKLSGEDSAWGTAIVCALLGNSISGLANSAYLPGSSNWVFLSVLLLVAVHSETLRHGAREDVESSRGESAGKAHAHGAGGLL